MQTAVPKTKIADQDGPLKKRTAEPPQRGTKRQRQMLSSQPRGNPPTQQTSLNLRATKPSATSHALVPHLHSSSRSECHDSAEQVSFTWSAGLSGSSEPSQFYTTDSSPYHGRELPSFAAISAPNSNPQFKDYDNQCHSFLIHSTRLPQNTPGFDEAQAQSEEGSGNRQVENTQHRPRLPVENAGTEKDSVSNSGQIQPRVSPDPPNAPWPGHASWDDQDHHADFDDDEVLEAMESLIRTEQASESDDSCSVTRSDEEEMVLLASSFTPSNRQVPPSNVLKDTDPPSSTTIDIFNLTPEHPTLSKSAHGGNLPLTARRLADGEDLFDEEIDWDGVVQTLDLCPKNLPLSASPAPAPSLLLRPPSSPSPLSLPQSRAPKPGIRHNFPLPVPSKSPIPGLTSTTILRICFHINHFLTEASRCHRVSQDAIFEWYARVASSWREERPARIQLFRFADLYQPERDEMQCLDGALTGWKPGGEIERLSAVFLETSGAAGDDGFGNGDRYRHRDGLGMEKREMKMCRCVCRAKRDGGTHMGWTVQVHWIGEVSWDEVEKVRKVFCADSGPGETGHRDDIDRGVGLGG